MNSFCRKEIEGLRKELSKERSSLRMREESLVSLQKEKALLESELRQTIQRNENETNSFRLSELQDQIETEQSLAVLFKLELQARREEMLEKDQRLQAMANLE